MRAKWSAPIRKYWKISEQIDPDTLMGFSPRMQSTDAVFSENAPIDYQVNDKAKMEYAALLFLNSFLYSILTFLSLMLHLFPYG